MSADLLNRKKTDLLKFQKGLNEQFLEIFSQKNLHEESVESSDSLGLTTNFRELNLFILLSDLQTIATKINYESIIKTKSWIAGFNQEHGKVYTILNMNKIFTMLFEDITDFTVPHLNINSHIVYLKSFQDENHGLLLEDFKLDYTAEFTLLFDSKTTQEGDVFYWELSEYIDFDSFAKKENMSKLEWDLLSKIKNFSNIKKEFQYGIFPEYQQNDKLMLIALMINKVYLDAYGKRPIFTLDFKNLTKFLINVSPF